MKAPVILPMERIVSEEPCSVKKTVTVSFQDLTYWVEIDSKPCVRKNSKILLKNITGNMKPGLHAVMGSSGSGKSTLLNALANRLIPQNVNGHVFYNGSKSTCDDMGYVTQIDSMMDSLTVEENLWFIANLRLPNSVKMCDKSLKIAEIISLLALEECKNRKIGNVSGGERKRTAVGVELVLRPSILFLDEPTTGLDACTAHAIMQLLKQLSVQGMNVIFSIHQPRFSIFKLFDTLTLLAGGKLVYQAPIQYTLSYFNSIGYTCSPDDNPANFLQDVVSGECDLETGALQTGDGLLSNDQLETHVNRLADLFANSSIFANLRYEVQRNVRFNAENTDASSCVCERPRSASVLKALCGRAFKNLVRNPMALTSSAIINLFIGVIFGLFYFQVDKSASTGIQNRLGFLFFVCSNMLFGSFGAVELFARERNMFQREYQAGYYKVWQYFLSKICADLLPLRTVCTLLFCVITYWMVGLKPRPEAFFFFTITVLLLVYAATGIGIFYSVTFKNFATSSICVSLTFIFSVLFDGFLVNINTVLPWLRWLKHFSISRYGFSALCVNELRHQQFLDCGLSFVADQSESTNTTLLKHGSEDEFSGNDSCDWLTGEDIIRRLSISTSHHELSDWRLWENIIALASIAIAMVLLTYLQLLRSVSN